MEGPDHFISYPRLYEQFGLLKSNGRFYTKDALTVWTNLGKHFVVRLVLRPKYKDGHKTHYAFRQTTFRGA